MRRPLLLLSPTERLQRNLDDGSAIASGTYTVTAPLTMTAQDGAIVRTTGKRVTLNWAGPAGGTMFVVSDCANPSFRDLDLRFPAPAATAMRVLRTGATVVRPSTGLHLKDVRIDGMMNLMTGVVFGAYTADANNEHAAFERVDLYNFFDRGVVVAHKQSKEHYFEHCRFGSVGAQVGVDSVTGFNWDKGAMYGMQICFRLGGGGGDRVSIRDVAAEQCARFLVQEHFASDAWDVLLDGITYRASTIAEDGEWIQINNAGPFNLVNSQVGGGQMPRVPIIALKGPATVARIMGNYFDAFGANALCPVRSAKCVVQWGLNVYQRGLTDDPRTEVIGDWTPQAMGRR